MCPSIVDPRVGSLAEKGGWKIRLGRRLLQLVDDAAVKHRLALVLVLVAFDTVLAIPGITGARGRNRSQVLKAAA